MLASMTDVRFSAEGYAELLGLYLGDGHISELRRTERLRLSLDSRYPRLVTETHALLRRCFPANRAGIVLADRGSTTVLRVYHQHLACLFRQHGPGKKHDRPIVLEPWQTSLVEDAPWAFIRGCIRSGGCAFVNRTGQYEYLSYGFTNYSPDILALFVETCEFLGLHARHNDRHVRLNRREDVRRLVAHVGIKS
jgi:hypothetical protein